MAVDATPNPRPGGLMRRTHTNGDTCRGEFVELVPHRRVVSGCRCDRRRDRFAELAEPLPATAGVSRSTMMGLPRLRREGRSSPPGIGGTGALLVKLAPTRVDELLAAGAAEPPAPAGRQFRQWAAVPSQRERSRPGCVTKRWRFAGG
jgi:hypothetical protein